MKDSAKKAKINPRDIERLEREYDNPQKEKIRRRKRRRDGDEAPEIRIKSRRARDREKS